MYYFQYHVKWKINSNGFIYKKGDQFKGYKTEIRNGYFKNQEVLSAMIEVWNTNHSYTGYFYSLTDENKAFNAIQKKVFYDASECGKGVIAWMCDRVNTNSGYIYIEVV
jgi:hypothetical protein